MFLREINQVNQILVMNMAAYNLARVTFLDGSVKSCSKAKPCNRTVGAS
ncbi:hypothetical protein SAMN05216345_1242 [Cupriavidus sp. YR651]|nr:hypothetical protein SAMN05216345_1242 [Cupriavidus sp. YR651]